MKSPEMGSSSRYVQNTAWHAYTASFASTHNTCSQLTTPTNALTAQERTPPPTVTPTHNTRNQFTLILTLTYFLSTQPTFVSI